MIFQTAKFFIVSVSLARENLRESKELFLQKEIQQKLCKAMFWLWTDFIGIVTLGLSF